jgi:hypothetical protein
MIVHGSANKSALAQYLKTNFAVVEVQNGESQEEAWRRYLAGNPESVGVRVKIFHYREPSNLSLGSAEPASNSFR